MISVFLYLLIIVFVFVCIVLSLYKRAEIRAYLIEIKYYFGIYSMSDQAHFLNIINLNLSSSSINIPTQIEAIPVYKNFHLVFLQIVQNAKNFGAPKNAPLIDLKRVLEIDFKFDRKINKLLLESIIQIAVLSFFTWLFIFAAKTILNFKMQFQVLSFIFLFQLFGLLITVLILLIIKKRSFSEFEFLFSELIKMKGLISAQIPLGLVSKQIPWTNLEKFQNSLQFVVMRLNTAIKATIESGANIKDEIDAAINEMESIFENKMDFFQTQLKFFQFLSLSFFQLPSFLIVIYYLLSQSFQSL